MKPPFAPTPFAKRYSLLTADPRGGAGGARAGGKKGDEKGEGEREGEGENEATEEATKQSPERGRDEGRGGDLADMNYRSFEEVRFPLRA